MAVVLMKRAADTVSIDTEGTKSLAKLPIS
jgi:hypothetical protein